MRLSVLLAFLLLAGGSAAGELASPADAARRLDIRPQNEAAWNARAEDVKKVLYAAGGELLRYFPDRKLEPILVEPQGGPIVLHERGPQREFRVKLDVTGRLWARYSFQFAHELCHILCRYNTDKHSNRWFEESLCELASLFTLRAMSQTWKTAPPYPNWKEYSVALFDYAEQRQRTAKLAEGVTLAKWYAEQA